MFYRFNIGKTQAGRISKNREIIRSEWQSGTISTSQKKRFLNPKGSFVDKKCFEWFVHARSLSIPISGPIIKAKAKEIAAKSGYNDFSASDGWLDKWRKRHSINFKCISGEASSVNQFDVTEFNEKLPSIVSGYEPRDIYNADESGLFFRALPDKTMALKSEKCFGGKLSKERLTILFCVNMVGEKEKLLVIGKAARPRAFKNVNIKDLPAFWKHNKKAWMTRDIMAEWLEQFDRKMSQQNRKILLFLDNAASHPKDIILKNIKIVFLPPNTTSVCQPLDQGVIQNFKVHYRTAIIKNLLPSINFVDSAKTLIKTVNVLDALYFIKQSWEKVTPKTIENCFGKAGFKKRF